MYISGFFKETDVNVAIGFMQSHPFAALVAVDKNIPIASHLVLNVQTKEDVLYAEGHMARSNPLWKLFKNEAGESKSGTGDVLLMFSGPNAYISARWYDHVNVPTWNYIAVHAYGSASVITARSEINSMMQTLVSAHETGDEYSFEGLPGGFRDQQMEGIVAFKIVINRLESSYKLSQNRNDVDYKNIIFELEKQSDPRSHEIASEMRKKRNIIPK
ncbi:MAG: FMN-binding negative transcriptional regulator [Chloroflexota bacterium]